MKIEDLKICATEEVIRSKVAGIMSQTLPSLAFEMEKGIG